LAATNIVLVINSSGSTSITFTPVGPFMEPVAQGTVLGIFSVTPTGWSGTVVISGADAASVVLNMVAGVPTLAAAAVLSAGTYNLTATSSP
jgi:hypothetical protein